MYTYVYIRNIRARAYVYAAAFKSRTRANCLRHDKQVAAITNESSAASRCPSTIWNRIRRSAPVFSVFI